MKKFSIGLLMLLALGMQGALLFSAASRPEMEEFEDEDIDAQVLQLTEVAMERPNNPEWLKAVMIFLTKPRVVEHLHTELTSGAASYEARALIDEIHEVLEAEKDHPSIEYSDKQKQALAQLEAYLKQEFAGAEAARAAFNTLYTQFAAAFGIETARQAAGEEKAAELPATATAQAITADRFLEDLLWVAQHKPQDLLRGKPFTFQAQLEATVKAGGPLGAKAQRILDAAKRTAGGRPATTTSIAKAPAVSTSSSRGTRGGPRMMRGSRRR